MFPPLAFPLTVLWTLRPDHTWVFHGPGYSKEPSLPLRKTNPQSKSSLRWEENCFVYRSEGEPCVRVSDVLSERELARLCSQVPLVRKSLKCSRYGSQVRMMRNMLVLCFVCLICVWFFFASSRVCSSFCLYPVKIFHFYSHSLSSWTFAIVNLSFELPWLQRKSLPSPPLSHNLFLFCLFVLLFFKKWEHPACYYLYMYIQHMPAVEWVLFLFLSCYLFFLS